MEPIFKHDETKRIIEELHDPLLTVEFNPMSMEWEILKLTHGVRSFSIPGFLVCSASNVVTLNYCFEYHSVQATFKHWGSHVFNSLRKGRPEFREAKEIINSIQVHDDKVQEKNKLEMDDIKKCTRKEIEKTLKPTLYSYSKAS